MELAAVVLQPQTELLVVLANCLLQVLDAVHELEHVIARSHFAVLEAEVRRLTHVGVFAIQGTHDPLVYLFFANCDLLGVGEVMGHPLIGVALLSLSVEHGGAHLVQHSAVLHSEVLQLVVDFVLGRLASHVLSSVVGLVAGCRIRVQHLLEKVS